MSTINPGLLRSDTLDRTRINVQVVVRTMGTHVGRGEDEHCWFLKSCHGVQRTHCFNGDQFLVTGSKLRTETVDDCLEETHLLY